MNPASPSQISYITGLLTQRVVPAELAEGITESLDSDEMTAAAASVIITTLKSMPWAPKLTAAPVTEAGMYRAADGQIYRVQPARGGDRKLYAKLLRVTAEIEWNDETETEELVRDADGNQVYRASFEYAPAAIYKLSATDKMSTEDRSAFGHEFGICCTCGRTLTDPESIARGQGPICAAK